MFRPLYSTVFICVIVFWNYMSNHSNAIMKLTERCVCKCFYESTLDLVVFSASLTGYKLNVGFITRVRLNHLLDAGDITAQKVELFHTANFFVKAVEYALQRLPLSEPLLKHARFLDVRQRAECGVEDALYFVDR